MARGFASLSPERRREVAAEGGRAVQAKGTGHAFTSKTGKAAGEKGGHISRGGRGKHGSTDKPTHPRAKTK